MWAAGRLAPFDAAFARLWDARYSNALALLLLLLPWLVERTRIPLSPQALVSRAIAHACVQIYTSTHTHAQHARTHAPSRSQTISPAPPPPPCARRQNFKTDSADIILLVLARLSVLPLIALMAAYKGKPPNAVTAPSDSNDDEDEEAGSGRKPSLCRRVFCWFRARCVRCVVCLVVVRLDRGGEER